MKKPAFVCSLISTFVLTCLDSSTSLIQVSSLEISRLWLVFAAEHKLGKGHYAKQ